MRWVLYVWQVGTSFFMALQSDAFRVYWWRDCSHHRLALQFPKHLLFLDFSELHTHVRSKVCMSSRHPAYIWPRTWAQPWVMQHLPGSLAINSDHFCFACCSTTSLRHDPKGCVQSRCGLTNCHHSVKRSWWSNFARNAYIPILMTWRPKAGHLWAFMHSDTNMHGVIVCRCYGRDLVLPRATAAATAAQAEHRDSSGECKPASSDMFCFAFLLDAYAHLVKKRTVSGSWVHFPERIWCLHERRGTQPQSHSAQSTRLPWVGRKQFCVLIVEAMCMSKNCTPLWREAHSQVKILKKLTVSGHFWKFWCRKIVRRFGEKHIHESKC